MVGPGEVDDDLEPETAEECTKYGEVEKCVIFEVNLCRFAVACHNFGWFVIMCR